jgi:RNA polymerase-binding transcription factor DksA
VAALSERFAAEDVKRLRRALLDRGLAIATRLEKLMSGADANSIARALGLTLKPGARPEEVLRRALDQVDGLRKLIDADDDRYGRCTTCGLDLGLAALREVPWADACPAHAG